MRQIVDFHLHSKYARATSKYLDVHEIAKWSAIKGLDIVSTGDFTHPKWFAEIEKNLTEDGSGLLSMKEYPKLKFILGAEVACIYNHSGATRRVHHLILSPTIAAAAKINELLTARGCKLASDGRPILGMSSKELLQIVLEADPRNVIIPAHAWTPWFAIFGSKSGYDSVQECFEDLTPHVFALETGLSSDPAMNWMVSKLDDYVLVSNSDAHSGPKIGREANVFDLTEPSYDEIMTVLKTKDKKKFLYTIEFFPEEGMYHYDGHRLCNVSMKPAETKRAKGICPVCHKPITVGVLNRVDNLADRKEGEVSPRAIPFKNAIPLPEIIADYFHTAATSTKVMRLYQEIIVQGHNEFHILLDMEMQDLKKSMPVELAEAVMRIRNKQVIIEPGYDGKYGKVSVFSEASRRVIAQQTLL